MPATPASRRAGPPARPVAGPPAAARYDAVSRALHWLTALLVLGIAALGLVLGHAAPADEPTKFALYNIHESVGLTVLALTLLRLAWRAGHPAPPLPAGMPAPLRLLARANHAAFYALLLAMPVVGFLATNAWGFPVRLYGLVPLPDPVGRNPPLAETLSAIHAVAGWTLLGLIALHVAGALWHGLVRRDGTLRRMA